MVTEIITDAVDIETEFITGALPVDLIGMNSRLMKEVCHQSSPTARLVPESSLSVHQVCCRPSPGVARVLKSVQRDQPVRLDGKHKHRRKD